LPILTYQSNLISKYFKLDMSELKKWHLFLKFLLDGLKCIPYFYGQVYKEIKSADLSRYQSG